LLVKKQETIAKNKQETRTHGQNYCSIICKYWLIAFKTMITHYFFKNKQETRTHNMVKTIVLYVNIG